MDTSAFRVRARQRREHRGVGTAHSVLLAWSSPGGLLVANGPVSPLGSPRATVTEICPEVIASHSRRRGRVRKYHSLCQSVTNRDLSHTVVNWSGLLANTVTMSGFSASARIQSARTS